MVTGKLLRGTQMTYVYVQAYRTNLAETEKPKTGLKSVSKPGFPWPINGPCYKLLPQFKQQSAAICTYIYGE